jgi:hypothetical protein
MAFLWGAVVAIAGCLKTHAFRDSNWRSETREGSSATQDESRMNSSISGRKPLAQPNIRDIIGRWGVVFLGKFAVGGLSPVCSNSTPDRATKWKIKMKRFTLIHRGRMFVWLVAFMGLGVAIALVSARAADRSTESQPSSSERSFVDVCETNPNFSSTGLGGLSSESGHTFVSIPAGRAETTRYVVSAAYGSTKHPIFRLVVQDAQGNRHQAISQTVVSGAGSKYGVVTIDCEFDLATKAIEQLILQRQTE